MDELSERFTIQVRIGQQKFPITIPRIKEEIFRKAERMINEKIGFFEKNYPNHGIEKNMSLALLDFCTKLLQREQDNDTEPICKALSQLVNEMEEAIGTH